MTKTSGSLGHDTSINEGGVYGPFPSPGGGADEVELHMQDWTSHPNDALNLVGAIKVRVVTEQLPANINGGLINDVRIK